VDRLDGRCVDYLVHVQRNRRSIPKLVRAQVEKEQQMSIEITDEMVQRLRNALPLGCAGYVGNDEARAAHTALVERLHDVTTMLEAERARIADAPTIAPVGDKHGGGYVFWPMSLLGKRVALVVVE
jgi:hypothetical protein